MGARREHGRINVFDFQYYNCVLNSSLLAKFKRGHCLSYTKRHMSSLNKIEIHFSTAIKFMSVPEPTDKVHFLKLYNMAEPVNVNPSSKKIYSSVLISGGSTFRRVCIVAR